MNFPLSLRSFHIPKGKVAKLAPRALALAHLQQYSPYSFPYLS